MTAARDRSCGAIAVIGMACRFPGADSPAAFWQNLIGSVESITRLTDEELRLAGVAAELLEDPHYVKAAPLLQAADAFDAEFFDYAPREARLMDPQQRQFLEVAWETFEAAGYDPLGAKGVVGIFAGAGGLVSSQIVQHDLPELRGQTGDIGHIGNDRDFLCSRVAFKLDLIGPSVNVQTACSTSLVAVHLACQSLRAGESDMALAGAAVVRVPQVRGYLAEPGNIYAPDGHCRPFAADADGTLFGSGVAAVLLKPLPAALADGDDIHAVIRGSWVTNDGGDKFNFTASAPTQQALAVSRALELGGVEPDSIGYVECHGTATSLGDPVEIQALTRAFRRGSARRGFCAVGSVKSNFGHLEQCAGIAGLIKAVLALRHGVLPPSLHFDEPNPRIPFARSPFYVNARLQPFARGAKPRRAGVNSIGMGGTNAFAVLEEAPPRPPREASPRRLSLLCLSAKNEAALERQMAHFAELLTRDDGLELRDVCFTANCGRHHFDHCCAVLGADRAELVRQLERARGGDDGLLGRRRKGRRDAVVFLYSGQGSQYARMGARLYAQEAVFRSALDECLALFRDLGIDTAAALFGDDERRLGLTLYTQTALFALQVALTRLWREWGVEPHTVIGHSVGEFAAAHAAGVLSLEDAAKLVGERARLMSELPPGGAMAAVAADPEAVDACWPRGADDLAVAADNAPASVVVSGGAASLAQLTERLAAAGIAVTALDVSHAFHSPLMAPLESRLAGLAADVVSRAPARGWISTVTGAPVTAAPDAAYWSSQALRPVCFRRAVLAAGDIGDAFVEIGPGATLLGLARRTLGSDAAERAVWVASLARDRDDERAMLEALRRLYLDGQRVRWRGVESTGGRRVALPTYPFQRTRWHLPARAAAPAAPAPSPAAAPGEHALLSARLGGDAPCFEALVSLRRLPFLGDHRVYGRVVLPTAAALDAVMVAAVDELGMRQARITEFVYQRALEIAADEPLLLQLSLDRRGDRADFRLESTAMSADADWTTHITGTVHDDPSAAAPTAAVLDGTRGEEIAAERFYRFLDGAGLSYGPAFRGIVGLWRDGDAALARVELPNGLAPRGWLLHPAFLDACLHVYAALVKRYGDFDATGRRDAAPAYVPIGLDAFELYRGGVERGWVRASVSARHGDDEERITLDVDIYADDGAAVGRLRGLTVRAAREALLAPAAPAARASPLYRLAWRERARAPAAAPLPTQWIVFADAHGIALELAQHFRALGHECVLVAASDAVARDIPAAVTVAPGDGHGMRTLLAKAAPGPVGIVYLWPLLSGGSGDGAEGPTANTNALVCGGCLHIVQSFAALREAGRAPRLWLVTRGAQAADGELTAPAQSLLWGLGRSVALEEPQAWGGLIDLPPAGLEGEAELLLSEIAAGDGEDQVALRRGRRLAPRLIRHAAGEDGAARAALAAQATYWVVGGLGGVGLEIAAALVEAGARHLVLTGRRLPAQTPPALAELQQRADVAVLAADASRPEDVERVVEHIRRRLPPLRGLVHAAAVFEDAVLSNTSWAQFERVLAPKVTGAWLLHRRTADLGLDFFVLCSSVLSLWGAAGQGAYAAANAFLDALACARRAAGLPATVFNWGPWAGVGATERWSETAKTLWRQRGTAALPAQSCTQTLLDHLTDATPQLVVCDTDWPVFLRQFAHPPALLHALEGPAAAAETVPPGDGDETTLATVRRLAGEVLGVDGNLDVDRPLSEMGLDSLLAVNLANRLQQALGVTVPTALLLQGVSVAALHAKLCGGVAPAARASAPATERTRTAGDGWFILPRPNPGARVRLLCFPFAGGGATTFRSWAEALDTDIELVAIEPPGRQSRIDEPPIRDMDTFQRELLRRLEPFLDKPFAVYGHCLGALTVYETVRRLRRQHARSPLHVFVSGARPPDQLQRQQAFERNMLAQLLRVPEYDVFKPIYRQSDDVFADVILQFNIPATRDLLNDTELRRLLLPLIRSEFEMASRYRYVADTPWNFPVTCFHGVGDPYASEENARAWGRFTNSRFQLFVLEAEHFLVVDEDRFVIDVINRELGGAGRARAAAHAH